VRVLLISTYELGRQPFGLASPAAWLRAEGHEVAVADLACGPLPQKTAEEAALIAFFLPMHTATRLAFGVVEKVRAANPAAHLCAYGLYAPLNRERLRDAGVETVIGGEFEQPLAELARRLEGEGRPRGAQSPERVNSALCHLQRQQFRVPDRAGLPPLAAYARLIADGASHRVGSTEASRGCKHRCRHCPVVPVYNGIFRVVQAEVVLEDIRRQVAAGAEHITFGDPDFFNGPGHALAIIEALHREWPALTYDVTIKIEHLLKHRVLLPRLRDTGCRFVTSAVESLDDAVLAKLDKGHTRLDFLETLRLMREIGLPLAPTFIPFTPWTTLDSYRGFLADIAALDLVEQAAPIQLAIRLLIPEGSLLLQLPEIRNLVGPFDPRALCYPWRNADPEVDRLAGSVLELVQNANGRPVSRTALFGRIAELAGAGSIAQETPRVARATIPYLTEPWYC
jgi:radical SAM superfamily enzyme YgiQ (UPF0313 family)